MIEARGVSVRYEDGRLALNYVTFTVTRGEAYCLLGPRGAGKTTLHNVFLGLVTPVTGKTLINGVDCAAERISALRNLAILSEKPAVYEYISCRANLELLARLSGGPVPSSQELVSAIREVGLPDRILGSSAKVLSPVWKQKLLLAAALVRKAQSLFLDDPTESLDASAAKEFIQELRKLKARGVAVMLTTHDPLVARELGDRIGLLDRGLITRELDPASINANAFQE